MIDTGVVPSIAPSIAAPDRPSRKARALRLAGGIVFWSWNLLFLALALFGIVPEILVSAVADAVRGVLPWDLAATGVLLTLIPIVSVAWAIRAIRARRRGQARPGRLPALFFGLEAPLCLLCLARMFLVRELVPALGFVLVCFFTAASFFAVDLVGGLARRPWVRAVQLAGHTVGLLVALYAGALLAFYALPAGVAVARDVVSLSWLRDFASAVVHSGGRALFFAIVGLPLAALSAALFVGTPIALPWLYLRSFARVLRAHRAALGDARAAAVPGAVAVAVIGLFLLFDRQPQRAALAALSEPPRDDAARARLLGAEDDLRAGLLAAYLAPYRYLGARGGSHDIEWLYRQELGFSESAAAGVERLFLALASPAIYDGPSLAGDGADAERLYAAFFDSPIQKRESAAVLRALTTTYSRAEREAGLIDCGRRRVRLARQEVTVTEHGPVAEVEIHDRWENQTPEPEEVVLTFTLPEEAAVTGLWLGDSDDRQRRWAAVVSPRGAARAVYLGEVRQRRDPALLEQIGPRQYRLRAFPVPAKAAPGSATTALHVWLTYATFNDGGPRETDDRDAFHGGCTWPMPHLVERRNAFWDGGTERVLRDEGRGDLAGGWSVVPGGPDAGERWTGGDAAACRSVPAVGPLTVALPGGRALRRRPWSVPIRITGAGRRLAVVVDRSFSMRQRHRELGAELDWLRREVAPRNDVDLFLPSAQLRGEPPRKLAGLGALDGAALLPFGGASLAEMLAQVDALAEGARYDAVLVLTDDGSLDLAAEGRPPATPAPAASALGPLWLVHLGGALPPGYDDAVLARLQHSRGGIAASVAEALDRQALLAAPGVVSASATAVWEEVTPPAETSPPAGDLAPVVRLAARQLILARTREIAAASSDRAATVAALDDLHALAARHRVVSAYSSMIVLVDDLQRQALAAAERSSERFDREGDPQSERKSAPFNPFGLAAAPEPHEWILIALAALAVAATARRRRLSGVPGRIF